MLRHTRKMLRFKPNKLFTFKKANKKANRITKLNASSQSQKKKYYKKKSTSAKNFRTNHYHQIKLVQNLLMPLIRLKLSLSKRIKDVSKRLWHPGSVNGSF